MKQMIEWRRREEGRCATTTTDTMGGAAAQSIRRRQAVTSENYKQSTWGGGVGCGGRKNGMEYGWKWNMEGMERWRNGTGGTKIIMDSAWNGRNGRKIDERIWNWQSW